MIWPKNFETQENPVKFNYLHNLCHNLKAGQVAANFAAWKELTTEVELKPSPPKYCEIWDVKVVLDYLKTFDELSLLPLKDLTLNLTMLLCLTTGQRGQTITGKL